MRIRTTAELIDRIAEQLAWRRKELSELRALIDSSRHNRSRQTTLIRAGLALLYAHWEGFIKCAGTYFLEFVSEQRNTHAELNSNWLCVILRKRLNAARHSKKVTMTGDIVDFFVTQMGARARIPQKGVVDTESNLSSRVLAEILWTLGLDEGPYATKKNLLDESLLARRNHIAHGEPLDVSVDDYLVLHDEILTLIEEFRNQVENACVRKSYLRPVAKVPAAA